MHTNPNEILVKRSDLLPIEDYGDHYIVDGLRYSKDIKPSEMRLSAMRFLSVAVQLEDDEADKAAEKVKQWELEHAVPLARKMHDTFHSFSSNYPEVTDEDLWLRNYKNDNHLVKKWVWTATEILKAQEATGE